MKQQLINIAEQKLDIIIDLRYASSNNFTKEIIYKTNECLLHFEAFEHLSIACELAQKLNYKINRLASPKNQKKPIKIWSFYCFFLS